MNRSCLLVITLFAQLLVSTYLILLLKYTQFLETIVITLCLLIFTVGSMVIYREFYKGSDWKRLFKAFRLQKHDFQNHLQIISSMVQLCKYDKILNYVGEIKRRDDTIDKILSLNNEKLTSVLLEMVCSLRQKDIDLRVEIFDENCRIANVARLQREVMDYIIKLDKVQGKKNINMVIRDSKFEIYSPVLENMVV